MNGNIISSDGTEEDAHLGPKERSHEIQNIISEAETDKEGAPIEEVLDRAEERGVDREKGRKTIDRLQQWGSLYESREDHLRVT